jgi:hypothetical protein
MTGFASVCIEAFELVYNFKRSSDRAPIDTKKVTNLREWRRLELAVESLINVCNGRLLVLCRPEEICKVIGGVVSGP